MEATPFLQGRCHSSRKYNSTKGTTEQLERMSCQSCRNRSDYYSNFTKTRTRGLPWSVTLVTMVTFYLMTLTTPTIAIQQVQVDDNVNDIKNFLTVLEDSEVDVNNDKDSVVAKQPVSVGWGIPDATALAGKLFHYMLPQDAFKGDITEYKVTEAGEGALPEWMHFNQELRALQGVAGAEDTGRQYLLEVTAISHFSNDTLSHAKDIFAVNVAEDNTHSQTSATPLKDTASDGKMRPIRCPEASAVTMVTVIVDTDLHKMAALEKLDLLHGMARHLGMPPELLRMLPIGNKPMFDSSALVAGPGDVKKPSQPGAVMQWEVGCGNVNANHMPILQQLEATSSDSTLSKAVGHGIIGWHVTNNKPHTPHRMKRRANVEATPAILATPPVTVGPPTHQPVPTYVIDEDGKQATRFVPVMSSPSFPGQEIKPTKTKHKHHHRTKTKGRHHHKTKHMKHSPTKKHHGHKTMVLKTPMPTPTVLPIQPTRVLDVSHTIIDTAWERPKPTHGPTSPGISRTDVGMVEPSMTHTDKTDTDRTDILPTRTYVVPDVDTTEDIVPTDTEDTFTPPTKEPPTREPTKRPTSRPEKPETTTSTTRRTTTKSTTTSKPTRPEVDTGTDEPFNYAPILKNDISRISVKVGDTLNRKVPSDTFYDFEDGNTRNLKLLFVTVDGLTLPRNSWIKFNQTTQTLYGMPLAIHEGKQDYIMAAIDSQGKIARDAFEVVVVRRPHEKKINHEFSITLDTDYNRFLTDVESRLKVANRIAKLYGDKDTSKITVTRIEEGSVIFAWTNNSLPSEPCPVREIADLLSFLITKNNTLNKTLIDTMEPFTIKRAGATPYGSCKATGMPPKETDKQPPAEGPGRVETSQKSSNQELLVTTIVPAGIIVLMLLLAGIVACILYRRKRKGKLSDEDKHTFVNKGIPIIFADELEDKPDPPTKPLIMADEKPPLPPPEYHRGAGSVPSTPQSDHKEPYIEEEPDTDMMSPLYQPPPPFTGSREQRNSRPRNQQQSYRNPPPYVPP